MRGSGLICCGRLPAYVPDHFLGAVRQRQSALNGFIHEHFEVVAKGVPQILFANPLLNQISFQGQFYCVIKQYVLRPFRWLAADWQGSRGG
jgi:hypothetical protein